MELTEERVREIVREEMAAAVQPRAKATTDPRVREIMLWLEQSLGYVPQPYGKNAKAVKMMLKTGYSPDEIGRCWDALKATPFWSAKALGMEKVAEQIGEWKKHSANGAGAIPAWEAERARLAGRTLSLT